MASTSLIGLALTQAISFKRWTMRWRLVFAGAGAAASALMISFASELLCDPCVYNQSLWSFPSPACLLACRESVLTLRSLPLPSSLHQVSRPEETQTTP